MRQPEHARVQGHKGWRYGYFDEEKAPGIIQPLEFLPGDSDEVTPELGPALQPCSKAGRLQCGPVQLLLSKATSVPV